MKLSQQAAAAMQPGDRLADHVVRGLELRARGRSRCWYVYYRTAGKQRRPKIGEWPLIGIDEARRIAQEALRAVARGDDPSGDRKALRGAPTVAQLCSEYLERHARPNKAALSVAGDERNIKLHVLPTLGKLQVAEVTPAHVLHLHKRLSRTRPVLANRVLALLSKMFAVAEWDALRWRDRGTNPAKGDEIKRNTETHVERYLSPDETARLLNALESAAAEYPARVAVLYAELYTGARVSELVGARHDQREGNTLVLTSHKTAKANGRTIRRRIRLPRQAVAIIDALPDDGTGYVFGALTRFHVATVWEKVRDRAGLPDVRGHDLRHNFASFARASGVAKSLADVGELLGHRSAQTTLRYAHLFEEHAAQLAQATADAIDAAGGKG